MWHRRFWLQHLANTRAVDPTTTFDGQRPAPAMSRHSSQLQLEGAIVPFGSLPVTVDAVP